MIVSSVVASTEFAPFGQDPWWLVLLKVLGLFLGVVILVLLTIWAERRVVARMNMRVGPNRVGPFGVLQGLDGRHQAGPQGRHHAHGRRQGRVLHRPDHLRACPRSWPWP